MGAVVWCKKCKESSHYLDDVDWGFDCKHCGHYNEEGEYKRRLD